MVWLCQLQFKEQTASKLLNFELFTDLSKHGETDVTLGGKTATKIFFCLYEMQKEEKDEVKKLRSKVASVETICVNNT